MTHDFYWYDDRTKSHLVNGDGSDALTTHPATLEDFSYKSVAWHKKQLADMIDAGIDVVLPVYWGAPSEHSTGAPMHWSFAGLPPLVKAAEELLQEGKQPPAIGLFYDTSTLANNSWNVHVDLTTEYGKEWFYASIRDFFSMIPPRLWALIDGRPIVVLYSASFARAHDQGCIDHVKSEFPRQFGGRVPYIIREASWRVKADNIYAWGGAVRPNFLGVAEIGPGYDHSAVPGRTPLIVPREGGAFYERAWNQALRHRPHIVILETWNEFHEGTSIAESREHGRQYIDSDTQVRRPVTSAGSSRRQPKDRTTGQGRSRSSSARPTVSRGSSRWPMKMARRSRLSWRASPAASRVQDHMEEDTFTFRSMTVSSGPARWTSSSTWSTLTAPGEASGSSTTRMIPRPPWTGPTRIVRREIPLKGTQTWKTASFLLKNARFDGQAERRQLTSGSPRTHRGCKCAGLPSDVKAHRERRGDLRA